MRLAVIGASVMLFALTGQGAQPPAREVARPAGLTLSDVSWRTAEDRLRPDTVVVLPIGAAAIQHGPHLPLGTDARLTDYLTRRLVDELDVVVAPPFAYHHAPAFAEYPGSTSLSSATARDAIADVARSIARHGPRRFYALNPSRLPMPALDEAVKVLAREGLLLRPTDAHGRLEPTVKTLQRQPIGLHADEIETSMLLYIDSTLVEMSRATRELAPESSPFQLSRRDGGRGTYSATGVWGDATLATREKGRILVEALYRAVRGEIDDLRRSPPPVATEAPAQTMSRPSPGARGGAGSRSTECLPGDERIIRSVGPAFAVAWIKQDPLRISQFWMPEGDMVHPDGFIEGSALRILENRTALFMRPEYKNSRHSLTIGSIRCIAPDIAIADGKWELRNVTDSAGQTIPPSEGLCTLVLRRRVSGGWGIEAWRYSSPPQISEPTLLQRPGFLRRR